VLNVIFVLPLIYATNVIMVFDINIAPHMFINLHGLIWLIKISYITPANLFSIKNSTVQFFCFKNGRRQNSSQFLQHQQFALYGLNVSIDFSIPKHWFQKAK